MMYSVLSITTKATPLSAVTMMESMSFLRFSRFSSHFKSVLNYYDSIPSES